MADRDRQSQGVVRSLAGGGYSLTVRGAGSSQGQGSSWFGPLTPMPPIAPDSVKGRILDYPSGYNLNIQPRSYSAITFPMLRAFADSYDLLRLLIETRKDQMARLQWNIVPRDRKLNQKNATLPEDMETRINFFQEFFLMPDKENFWSDWLSLLLEDLFVIDAPTLYRRRTYGGEMYGYQALDGGTIKRVIDDWGNTPEPPNPAYQQVLKGYPAVDYTTDELIYRPRVKRTHQIYGYSPVEQVIMTINIGLRRQAWQLESFTEGNIPEALIGTPATWTPDQVRQFQDWFDSMLQGNTGERRRARFVPGDVAKGYVPTKPSELFGQAEEWLARVLCFAFNISPQAFVQQMNRATAETAQETAVSEGLAPIQNWVKGLIDFILIKDFDSPDLEFRWKEEDELDPDKKSQIIDREQAAGRMTYNEARKEQGLDTVDHPDADRPMFKTATGWVPIFLTPEEQAAKDAAAKAMQDALGAGGAEDDGAEDGSETSGAPAASQETPPDDTEGATKAAMPDGLAKEWDESQVERDEHGRFSDGGGGTEGSDDSEKEERTADNWRDVEPNGFGGGKGTPEQQSKREVERQWRNAKDAPEGRAERMRSVASTHRSNAERMAETAANWASQGHYDTAADVMASSKFQSMHADALEAKADKAEKSDEPEVAEKSDRPFVHPKDCGCGLAKAGRATNSRLDPLRPFAAKLEKRLARKMAMLLRTLGKRVARQVEDKLADFTKDDKPKKPSVDIDKLLAELDLEVFALAQDDLENALENIGRDASRIALAQVGMTTAAESIVERVNQRALEWAEERAAELVSFDDDADPALAAATRDMLRATIASGIEQNIGMPEIAAQIEESYAFSEERALLIASTEITSANSMGALASYEAAKEEGVTLKKSWLILEDACDICQENADQGPIDLDEEFPSGDMAPGAHPNCRCVLVPEVEDADGNLTEIDDEIELVDRGSLTKRDNQEDMAKYFPVDLSLRGPIWVMGGNTEEAVAEREASLLQFVPFEQCIATQDYCDHDKVRLYLEDPTAKGFAPMAYFDGEVYAIQDGHHRAVAKQAVGEAGMAMHVKDIDGFGKGDQPRNLRGQFSADPGRTFLPGMVVGIPGVRAKIGHVVTDLTSDVDAVEPDDDTEISEES